MKLPRIIRYRWVTEYARNLLKGNSIFVVPEIDLQIELCANDVVIDCGANVGDVTSKLARTGATVYAFEPNPYCFAILKNRFRAISNVTCLNVGVLDKNCKLKFRVPDAHGPFDTIAASLAGTFEVTALDPSAYTIHEAEIECIDLNEFISSLHRPIRFLKLDIEGSEIAVLHKLINSGLVHLIDLIAVETHERQMPELSDATAELRQRIERGGLDRKIRLDWP